MRARGLVKQGYIWAFGGVVNPKSLKVAYGLGAEIVATIPKKVNGKIINAYFGRRDLRVTASLKLA